MAAVVAEPLVEVLRLYLTPTIQYVTRSEVSVAKNRAWFLGLPPKLSGNVTLFGVGRVTHVFGQMVCGCFFLPNKVMKWRV